MRSRVKRAPRTNEPLLTNRKEVHVNLNDDDQEEIIPLEYNFSTQNASLNGKTYTFSFPDMWRTSKNKNIIGIRKISYFKELFQREIRTQIYIRIYMDVSDVKTRSFLYR